MRNISTAQKHLTVKYHCAILATVEYRKAPAGNSTNKMKLPCNDDIADARAMIYRPNVIFHVYNDLHERKEDANCFWIDPETKQKRPRLMILIGKNKITSFKSPENKLFLDLDPITVTMGQVRQAVARKEAVAFVESQYEEGD